MSLESIRLDTSITNPPPAPPEEEPPFSYVTAFAAGGYTFGFDSSTTDKARVIGMWVLSFAIPLFPAIAFFACWIKDLVDLFTVPNTEAFQLPLPSEEEQAALASNNEELLGDLEEEEESIETSTTHLQQTPSPVEKEDEDEVDEEVASLMTKEIDATNKTAQHLLTSPQPPSFTPSFEIVDTTSPLGVLKRSPSSIGGSPVIVSTEDARESMAPSPFREKLVTRSPLFSPPAENREERSPSTLPPAKITAPPIHQAAPPKPTQPAMKKAKNLLGGISENHTKAVHTMIQTMAEGNGSAIQALNQGSISTLLEGLTPFKTLAVILSKRESVDLFHTFSQRKPVWIVVPVNVYESFCGDWYGIGKKRNAMGEEKWQELMADFEDFCNVERGHFAHKSTKDFIDSVVREREALHATVLKRMAQAAKKS